MSSCIGCGKELNQGNSKRVLVPGMKKRRLVCRRFPDCRPTRPRFSRAVENAKRDSPPIWPSKPNTTAVEAELVDQALKTADRTSNRLQVEHVKQMSDRDLGASIKAACSPVTPSPEVKDRILKKVLAKNAVLKLPGTRHGDPGTAVTVEGVLDYPPTPRARFFLRPATADKVRKALAGAGLAPTVTIEVLRVPADLVDADPDNYSDLVPVEITIQGGR